MVDSSRCETDVPTAAGGPVLVTGATGTIGSELIRLLTAQGVPVRALVRRRDQQQRLAGSGVEAVLGDLDDADSLRRALTGCDRLFLLTAPFPGQLDQERRAIDAAVTGGVQRLVRISAGDSNVSTDVPWAKAHAQADTYLATTELNWTVLRASAFLQNFAGSAPAIRRGILPQTTKNGAESWIDARDVAAVAARVLTEDGHDRATYFLTGPQALTMAEIAAVFGRVLGRRVRFVQLPGYVFAAMLRVAGKLSPFTTKGLRIQFAGVVRPGHDIDTTYEVPRLLGRPSRTVEDYLRDHLDIYR
ncbi:NAD-dependent epimerase/dehydratase family protein [Nakamurella flava]|uniref:NAD-dependent epimerase/dehydratase family protein n=1 Tax=Nakamurella flava TaxID=2576308 RepID=A0A4U6QE47_9ACTN|nr:NAD(P)H-binding protein [Nakamurella flava]TKV58474.1 NAD-dependent epimerase/dehydratase family protein [Nakamurella flava]